MSRRGAHGPLVLGLATALCAGAAAAVVVRGDAGAAHAAPDARAFQRLVGGLGLGPSLDLSRADSTFDPRVTSPSSARFEPTPAGDVFESHADLRRVP